MIEEDMILTLDDSEITRAIKMYLVSKGIDISMIQEINLKAGRKTANIKTPTNSAEVVLMDDTLNTIVPSEPLEEPVSDYQAEPIVEDTPEVEKLPEAVTEALSVFQEVEQEVEVVEPKTEDMFESQQPTTNNLFM